MWESSHTDLYGWFYNLQLNNSGPIPHWLHNMKCDYLRSISCLGGKHWKKWPLKRAEPSPLSKAIFKAKENLQWFFQHQDYVSPMVVILLWQFPCPLCLFSLCELMALLNSHEVKSPYNLLGHTLSSAPFLTSWAWYIFKWFT